MLEIEYSEIKEFDTYVLQRNKLNKWFEMYYDEKINRDRLIKYSLPLLLKITNHYTSRLFKAFRIEPTKEDIINNGNKIGVLFQCQYWGLDNVLTAFNKAIDTYDYDKVNLSAYEINLINTGMATRYELETKFTAHFLRWIRSAFSAALKKAKKGKFKNKELIKMQVVSMDDERIINELYKYTEFQSIDATDDIEVSSLVRNFVDNHLTDQTDASIFGFMMQKYYCDKAFCNQDIARFVKKSEITVKRRKAEIRKLFQLYLKGELN